MAKDSLDLNGKSVLITGGGRGIGRAIALLFAQHGARLILVARTAKQLDAVAEEVKELGAEVLTLPADISQPAELARLGERIADFTTPLDILVNNAAVHKPAPVIETTLETWNETMTVNLTATFLLTRTVLPEMVRAGRGKIINVSSGAGLRGFPTNAAYSASKAGIIAFTQALAGEVREYGIEANVICPGPIWTEMHANRPGDGFLSKDSVFLHPQDVAGTALFLASSLSGQVTAQIFHVRNSDRW